MNILKSICAFIFGISFFSLFGFIYLWRVGVFGVWPGLALVILSIFSLVMSAISILVLEGDI